MPISGKMYVWGNRAKNVSKGPGVYALYNAEKVLIYVGVGASLREKFIHYLETDFSNDPRKRDTRYYRRELTSKREDRKKELLDEYRRKHGKFARARYLQGLPRKKLSVNGRCSSTRTLANR